MADLQYKFQIIGITTKCINDILELNEDSVILKKILSTIKSFNEDHTQNTLNFEVINSKNKISTLYSIRLSHGIRAILCNWIVDGKTIKNQFLIIHIEEDHDKSYAWANKIKSADLEKQLNQEILKIVMVEELEETLGETEESSIFLPFSDLTDTMFSEIDVDGSIVEFLRNLTCSGFESGKNVLCKSMKEYTYNTLSAYEQQLCDNESDFIHFFETEKDAYLKAEKLSGGMKIIDRDKELREAIENSDFEMFRLFLHPIQTQYVEDDYKGPVRVLGGAGTGKTVVALYRAKRLASTLKNDEKILFCTFTNSLIEDLKGQMQKLCTKEELSHIEILNISSLVYSFWNERGFGVLYDTSPFDALINKAITESNHSFAKGKSKKFYYDELEDVILQMKDISLDSYLNMDRTGRGSALSKTQREAVYRVIISFMEQMDHSRKMTPIYAAYKMAEVCNKENINPYKHIIIDECQDFHAAEYKVLRALAGAEHENDLFITGDLRQSVFERNAVLSNCGINIRGRGKYLYINYRTTTGIAKYAERIIQGMDFKDKESGSRQISEKTMSLLYGDEPVLQSFNSIDEEATFIVKHIKTLHATKGIFYGNICICMRTNSDISEYRDYFSKEGIPLLDVKDIKKTESKNKVHYSTCHNIKGLEYQYIILIKASENHFEVASSEKRINNTRKLLYVALTRAQRGVLITAPGPITKLLPQ